MSEKKRKRRSPAFQLYCASFLAGCICMTTQQVGAYIRLLCWQWENDFIPASEDARCKVVGCTRREMRAVWPVLCEKFVEKDGKLINTRLEDERIKQQANSEKQSKHGKAGAEKRWGTHGNPIASVSSPSIRSNKARTMNVKKGGRVETIASANRSF
mgnify:FL=1